MRAFLYRELLDPAVHAYRRDGVNRARRVFKRSQWLSTDAILALQRRKLTELLSSSAKNVPYYRDLLASLEISPDGDAALEAFQRIPPLTKQIIRQSGDAMVSESADRDELMANSTSGSTGESLKFYTDFSSRASRKAVGQRGDTWVGWRLGERAASLWGAPIDAEAATSPRGRIRDLVRGHRFFSSFDLSAPAMDKMIDVILRFKPKLFVSYPGPLETFAMHCEERGVRFPSLQSIVSSAETLWPHQRELVERAFGVDVYDRYGSREFGHIAGECNEHDGLHISADRVFVEVVDVDDRPCAPGETGRMLVTDLYNYGMPLIRYDIGDRAVVAEQHPCACGRGFPKLQSVAGRTLEIVVTPDGRQIGGTFWTLLLRSRPGLRQFQVIQEQLDGVKIRYVRNSEFDESVLDYFTAKTKDYCGEDFGIEFEETESIDLTRSGKQRIIVSRLSTSE